MGPRSQGIANLLPLYARMSCLVNPAADRDAVPPPARDAAAFHASLPAALRSLASEQGCAELRAAVDLGEATRVLLVGSEGRTDLPPRV